MAGPFLSPDCLDHALEPGTGAVFRRIPQELEITLQLFEPLDVDPLERLDHGSCPEKIVLFGRGPLGVVLRQYTARNKAVQVKMIQDGLAHVCSTAINPGFPWSRHWGSAANCLMVWLTDENNRSSKGFMLHRMTGFKSWDSVNTR